MYSSNSAQIKIMHDINPYFIIFHIYDSYYNCVAWLMRLFMLTKNQLIESAFMDFNEDAQIFKNSK